MDAVLTEYLDADYLAFVLDYLNLIAAGCALGFICWALGFVVDWFVSFLRHNF